MILIKNYRGRLRTVLGALFGRTGIWDERFYLLEPSNLLAAGWRRCRSGSTTRKGTERFVEHSCFLLLDQACSILGLLLRFRASLAASGSFYTLVSVWVCFNQTPEWLLQTCFGGGVLFVFHIADCGSCSCSTFSGQAGAYFGIKQIYHGSQVLNLSTGNAGWVSLRFFFWFTEAGSSTRLLWEVWISHGLMQDASSAQRAVGGRGCAAFACRTCRFLRLTTNRPVWKSRAAVKWPRVLLDKVRTLFFFFFFPHQIFKINNPKTGLRNAVRKYFILTNCCNVESKVSMQ